MPRPWYFPFTRSYWCGNRFNDGTASDPIVSQQTGPRGRYKGGGGEGVPHMSEFPFTRSYWCGNRINDGAGSDPIVSQQTGPRGRYKGGGEGVPHMSEFPFTRSYWCGNRINDRAGSDPIVSQQTGPRGRHVRGGGGALTCQRYTGMCRFDDPPLFRLLRHSRDPPFTPSVSYALQFFVFLKIQHF